MAQGDTSAAAGSSDIRDVLDCRWVRSGSDGADAGDDSPQVGSAVDQQRLAVERRMSHDAAVVLVLERTGRCSFVEVQVERQRSRLDLLVNRDLDPCLTSASASYVI